MPPPPFLKFSAPRSPFLRGSSLLLYDSVQPGCLVNGGDFLKRSLLFFWLTGRRRAPIWGPPQQEGLGVKSEVLFGLRRQQLPSHCVRRGACTVVGILSARYGTAAAGVQDVPESRVVGPIHYSNMRKRGGGGQSGRRECSSTLRTHGVRACVRAHVSGGSSRHCTPEDCPKRIFVRGALLLLFVCVVEVWRRVWVGVWTRILEHLVLERDPAYSHAAFSKLELGSCDAVGGRVITVRSMEIHRYRPSPAFHGETHWIIEGPLLLYFRQTAKPN